MDIHMSGYVSGKPLTRFIGLKDGGVAAITIFSDRDGVQVVVSESNEEVSIAKASNGMFIVLINTKAFQTAMLCNKDGVGKVACFANELGYGSLRIGVTRGITIDEKLTAVNLDKVDTDEKTLMELKTSISTALVEMERKSGVGARYTYGDDVVDAILTKYAI